MVRFYMYIIYRLHDFFSKKNTIPIGDTIIVMCLIHFFQILTIGLYINIFINKTLPEIPKRIEVYLVAFLIYVCYYFLVFYNGKWKKWAEEFKRETQEERKKNGIKVWLFCWGSIIFFFLSLPLTFSLVNYLK